MCIRLSLYFLLAFYANVDDEYLFISLKREGRDTFIPFCMIQRLRRLKSKSGRYDSITISK